MNCYNHTDTPVVGTCVDCGRGFYKMYKLEKQQ